MNRFVLSIILGTCAFLFGGCVCSSHPSFHRVSAADAASCASLASGKITIEGVAGDDTFDGSASIELVKLWSRESGKSTDYPSAVRGKSGSGEITFISVPETPFGMILLDGAIQPVIFDAHDWTLWEFHGLGQYFPKCRWIIPDKKRVTIRGVGFADGDLIWKFDFSNPRPGLVIK